jgi:hypothetical protein
MRHRRVLIAFLFSTAVLAVALAGCDSRPARVPVSGTVTIDGQPVEHGNIMVVPSGMRPAYGKLGPGGKFTLTTFEENDGVAPGTHKVQIVATEPQGATAQKWHAPQKYSDLAKTDLQVTVDGPTEDLKIELTWDGGKPFVQNFGGGE